MILVKAFIFAVGFLFGAALFWNLKRDPAPRVLASAYGRCPQCGAPGLTRERCLGGNDRCQAGHEYPSRSAVYDK